MTPFEQKISFLNRYFVYKKYIEVNTEKIVMELNEYEETENIRSNTEETINAIKIAKEENEKLKPKVRKLNKKLLLVPATEAIDEKIPLINLETIAIKNKKQKEKKKEKGKPKKMLLIESDEEDL